MRQPMIKQSEILKNFLNLFEKRFYSNNYIRYESNGDRNKTLSTEEYFEEVIPYLKYIVNDLKKIQKFNQKHIKNSINISN